MNNEIFNKACEYYDNNEYEHAFKLFLDLANNGNIESKKTIANMIFHGIGTNTNEELAFHWYKEAAKDGDAESQYWYGNYLLELNCLDEGLQWIRLSADNNFLEAIHDLASYYFHGQYVDKDQKRAIDLYEKAALSGHKNSLNSLISATATYKGKFQALITIIKMLPKLIN